LDEGIGDTFVSSVGGNFFQIHRPSALAGIETICLRHENAQPIRKYCRHLRPIASPIFFWLNNDSFSSRMPSDVLFIRIDPPSPQ